MNILYWTPNTYKASRFAGGMGSKTRTIMAGWGKTHQIDVADALDPELAPFYDVVLIELLGLRNGEKLKERCEELALLDIPKCVYGSDSEVFRWSGNDLKMLSEVVTLWIPNMWWQANYFRDFELPTTDIVYEPIDTSLFRPTTPKKKQIVAGGTVSLEKQADFFIDLFTRLSDQDGYETVYLASSWGEHTAVNYELEAQLKAVTDHFFENISQSKVASVLGAAGIGVLNPFYETCNRLDMEMMASGITRVCGQHICYDERPTAARFTDIDDCLSVLATLTKDFTRLPDKSEGAAAVAYAEEHFSFEATLSQLNAILERVL